MSTIGADSFRELIEGAPDGFFVHDVEGHILDVNERSCRDLGYSRAEFLALTINDISCGATATENAVNWANAVPGMAITIEEIAVRKDRSTFPVEISLTCQIVNGRKLFLGLARDMSEREAAHRAMEALNSELEVRVEQRTAELRETHERLRAVMDSAHDVIVFQDRVGRYLMFNRSAEKLTGVPQERALGRDTVDVFGAEIGERLRRGAEEAFATGQLSMVEEAYIIGGEERIFLITRSLHRDGQGEIAGLVSIGRDVTELRRSERQVHVERDRLLLAARVGGIGIWDYDLVRDALHCDEQWYRIMGRDPDQPIASIAGFRDFIHPDDAERATEVEQTASRLVDTGQDYGIVFRIIRPDGEVRRVRSAAVILEDANGRPERAVGFVVDITEAWLAEEQLHQVNLALREEKEALAERSEELGKQADEDPLTGIANRRQFDRALERARLDAVRTGRPLALAMIDVDFFKLYNDHYGHLQGDAALQTVARILASAIRRPYDLAARYGGEEFVLLLPGTDRPEAVLERIAGELAEARLPHIASPVCPCLTISCGCVVASDLADLSAGELLLEGDKALYRAKEGGRNRIVVERL